MGLALALGACADDSYDCPLVAYFQTVDINANLQTTVDLQGAQAEVCFTPNASTSRRCARGAVTPAVSDAAAALSVDPGAGDALVTATESSAGTPGAPTIAIKWVWNEAVSLHDGDRYDVTVTSSAGAQLFMQGTAVKYQATQPGGPHCGTVRNTSFMLPAGN